MPSANKYDVVIIGSGVSGLVCANYLTDLGLRVLLLEQHYFVGGCCSSYRRKGFVFDVGVHYLGGLRSGGFMRHLLEELGILNDLEIKRIDPTDLIVFPDRRIFFWNDQRRTLAQLCDYFPAEAEALSRWFELLTEENLLVLFAKIRGRSFGQLLDAYFKNSELKAVFATLLGNLGLPSTYVSGIAGAILFRDYVLDGGYYPRGGTHRLSEVLRDRLERHGGQVRMKCKATRIGAQGGQVQGVELEGGEFISCSTVVSGVDARQTFFDLVGVQNTPPAVVKNLSNLKPSVSAFIVYLGLRRTESPVGNCPNIWLCKTYGVDNVYYQNFVGNEINLKDFLFCSFPSLVEPELAPPGHEAAHLLVLAPTKNEEYWSVHKQEYARKLIEVAKEVRPHIEQDIVILEPATPVTIERFTKNGGGSIYGWASVNGASAEMSQSKDIRGLYLVGHWVTKPTGQGGITMAAYSGRHAARLISKQVLKRDLSPLPR